MPLSRTSRRLPRRWRSPTWFARAAARRRRPRSDVDDEHDDGYQHHDDHDRRRRQPVQRRVRPHGRGDGGCAPVRGQLLRGGWPVHRQWSSGFLHVSAVGGWRLRIVQRRGREHPAQLRGGGDRRLHGTDTVANCEFDAPAAPNAGDFAITVVDASAPDLSPIVPLPTVTVSAVTPK